MKIVIEYYNPKSETVRTKGFTYLDTKSVVTETKTFDWDTIEEKESIFAWFYRKNNELRYCNGSYWKFVDPNVEQEYRTKFFPKHNTISNYYGGGVVD